MREEAAKIQLEVACGEDKWASCMLCVGCGGPKYELLTKRLPFSYLNLNLSICPSIYPCLYALTRSCNTPPFLLSIIFPNHLQT